MAAVSWPWDLCTVVMDGYTLAPDNDVNRTPFEDGLTRQARNRSLTLQTRSIRYMVKKSNYVAFTEWARDHAHAWFNWSDYEDGKTREMRVRGGYAQMATLEFQPFQYLEGEPIYTGQCVLEGLPHAVAV